ncbi:hypothetical protein OG698_45420 [Streptomyces sp. NBC_01003]|uniref:hypothetical protein n=1 Tax=Streptomyces sp. NBC_01003 TaxID=2903714 RepID=UPI00386DB5CE|nr:hypothetical protein OG698_45420 [Streptomyces sp. NBC_01003]
MFSYVVAMPFSTKTGSPERLAAQYIKDAYNTPSATKPANTSKTIPGRTADRLTRLYAKPPTGRQPQRGDQSLQEELGRQLRAGRQAMRRVPLLRHV